MVLYPLCSSSKGNAIYIGTKNSGILVDAGVGIRNYQMLLEMAGLSPECVKAIFVTHEHSDHVSGLLKITERFPVPVYGSRGTLEQLICCGNVAEQTKLYEINRKTAVAGDLAVNAFKTSHDSAQSLGYRITDGKNTVAVCTDLGFVSAEVQDSLNGCGLVMIESNYDDKMLHSGIYPLSLKRRIASETGHLSNDDCASEILRLLKNGTRKFVLGHLSEENNVPALALEHTVTKLIGAGYMMERDFAISIAPKRSIGKVYAI